MLYLRYTFLIICFVIASGHLNAQNGNAATASNLGDHMLLRVAEHSLYGDPDKEKPEGSPYLDEPFAPGDIYTLRAFFPSISMRYNIYEDFFEFKHDSQQMILDPNPQISSIVLNNRKFVVLAHQSKGKLKSGFFIQLDSGKVVLLQKPVIIFHDQVPAKALDTGPTPPKFIRQPDDFFIKLPNSIPVQVENLKKLIASFPDHQDELTAFSKKEKISFKRSDDLARLARYYNSL